MRLEEILPFLIHEFSSENDLICAIDELSKNFTTHREKIDFYLRDPRLVSAYTAFYLLTNLPKWEAVLERLPQEFLQAVKKEVFIDFGSGPGTYSLAYKNWLKKESQEIFQIEISPLMREQGKKIFEGLYPEDHLNQLQAPRQMKDSFLFFGHSSNELGAMKTLEVIETISPKHLLFIEPGTKDFFQQMLLIRKKLKDYGFNQLYPCPHDQECPLKDTSDWCHQYVQVKHSQDVERISQMAKKDRRMLPLTVAAFSRENFSRKEERIIRVYPETKFSFEWDVCQLEKIDRYQVLKRGMPKDQLKILEQALAGDSVGSQMMKMLEKAKRVKIINLNNYFF